MDYRREIDGLRALAVLPVILFHAGFDLFSGGFVGVDVFFVISGYLITKIILSELEQEKFSILNFYERRARRILPALFLVILVCIPFAWFWLYPSDMKDFAQSLVAVSTFSSNILFWRESGYFDTAAELKPLLHTWSLAVEEQYYVLFPIFLMLFWRLGMRWILMLLGVVFITSIATAQWAASAQPAAAFYLLPTRTWELLIGAFAAFYLSKTNGRTNLARSVSEVGGWLGIALILFAVFFYSHATPFPGFYALVPTIGTVLVILFATQQTTVGKFVGNKVFVGLGLISYSAYLWHQPLFAFAKQRSLVEPSQLTFITLSVLALVLAYFSWRYVETPFRKKDLVSRSKIFYGALLGTLFFISVGVIGHISDGFKERFEIPASVYNSIQRTPREAECFGKAGIHVIEDWFCELGIDSTTKDFLVFGDSHALSALPAFDSVATDLGISGIFAGTSGCTPFLGVYALRNDQLSHNCHALNKRVYQFVQDQQISTVFFIARWSYYTDGGYSGSNFSYISTDENGLANPDESRRAFEIGLENTITAYRSIGVNVIFLPQVPQQILSPVQIYSLASRSKEYKVNNFSVSKEKHLSLQRYVNTLFEKTGVSLIELDQYFCDESKCAVGNESASFYFDEDHLSLEGSKRLVDPIREAINKRNRI